MQLAKWWLQFPWNLRLVAIFRALAMLGAGGILFLGPLVFNRLGLASTTIGLGLALASGVGLISRFLSGYILDRGAALAIPLRIGAVLSISADLLLLQASDSSGFLIGQLLLGLGMGFYWPAAEFASACLSAPLPSSQGFALARTADALGIAAGTALGTLLAALFGADHLRWVYGVDISCMVLLLVLVGWLPSHSAMPNTTETTVSEAPTPRSWLKPLLPLLVLSLLGTGLINLQQSALPLDLANGGLARAGLPEVGGGLLMGVQLVLILLLQWPVGHRLGQQPVGVGLRLSLRSFAAACGLMALSALHPQGVVLLLAAQPLLALAITAFLPTITEAVIEAVEPAHQGLALGLYSQAWAISGISLPPIAGWMLQSEQHGLGLWLLMGGFSLLALPLTPSRLSR